MKTIVVHRAHGLRGYTVEPVTARCSRELEDAGQCTQPEGHEGAHWYTTRCSRRDELGKQCAKWEGHPGAHVTRD